VGNGQSAKKDPSLNGRTKDFSTVFKKSFGNFLSP
jgi:hypothetical protein